MNKFTANLVRIEKYQTLGRNQLKILRKKF
jgi:hypothetical protein